jgi:hypothetical protein
MTNTNESNTCLLRADPKQNVIDIFILGKLLAVIDLLSFSYYYVRPFISPDQPNLLYTAT